MSVLPPGAKAIMSRTGLLGYESAAATVAKSEGAMASAISIAEALNSSDVLFGIGSSFFIGFSFLGILQCRMRIRERSLSVKEIL